VPHYEYRDFAEFRRCLPIDRTLVAVETGGGLLAEFRHPERAVYLLGREDSGLPDDVLAACDSVVTVPTRYCLNVAVAGSIVLYARAVQE